MAATVQQILQSKGNANFSVTPSTTVLQALLLMAERNISAVLVMVGDLMTPNVLTVSPTHTIDDCMCIITNNHVRHLPVVDHGNVVGIISIGDAVKSVMEQQQATIDQLAGYIAGGMTT